eukprot:scaffold1166_cov261-Pinguiococcus_pyrenoidosus.AAC.60
MAMGIPTILSQNTGHLDIVSTVGDAGCYPVKKQVDLRMPPFPYPLSGVLRFVVAPPKHPVTVPHFPRAPNPTSGQHDWTTGWGSADQVGSAYMTE